MTAVGWGSSSAPNPAFDPYRAAAQPAAPQESNTAYKAAVAMGEAFGREPSFAILIDKHIPVRAGLGGPSTDAAATFIGADVPFFLYGPPAHLDGRGDTMRELFRPLTGTPVALVKPMTGGVSRAHARGHALSRRAGHFRLRVEQLGPCRPRALP